MIRDAAIGVLLGVVGGWFLYAYSQPPAPVLLRVQVVQPTQAAQVDLPRACTAWLFGETDLAAVRQRMCTRPLAQGR